jgi:hypothetical protein
VALAQGEVRDYDRMKVRHTVQYEDGDIELLQLWAPTHQIQVGAMARRCPCGHSSRLLLILAARAVRWAHLLDALHCMQHHLNSAV